MSLTFGAAIPGTFALAYPKDVKTTNEEDFYVNQYFRIIWAMPLFIALIQMLLISTVFKNETPVYLKEKGMEEELLTVMKKFYEPTEVRKRLDAL